jgi:ABC-type transporter Mla subunit MlaD
VPLGDLTPQLRTRLFRTERFVGLFVTIAAVVVVVGFVYYLYHTAERRGWFVPAVPYYTYVQGAEGLRVGDPVFLMGFSVGEILQIEAEAPYSQYDVFVAFEIRQPYYGYIWTDSKARIVAGDLLGGRRLEVTKGAQGQQTVYDTEDARPKPRYILVKDKDREKKVTLKDAPVGRFLEPAEDPTIAFRAEQLLGQLEAQLPTILSQVETVVAGAEAMVKTADTLAADARPILSNIAQITSQLSDPDGSLGKWLLPGVLRDDIGTILTTLTGNLEQVSETLANVTAMSERLREQVDANETLSNVSAITGSLREQVDANDHILDEISSLIVESDDLMQGLKRTWILRSTFESPAASIPEAIDTPLLAPPAELAP